MIVASIAVFFMVPQIAGGLAALGFAAQLAPGVAWQPAWIPEVMVVLISALALISTWVAVFRFSWTGRRNIGRAFSLLLVVNVLLLFTASIVAGSLVPLPLWTGRLSGFVMIAVSNLMLAPGISHTRMNMARSQY